MHGVIRDTDNPGADTCHYGAHYRQIITSAVSLVEEYVHPLHTFAAGFELAHRGSVLIEHLSCRWADLAGQK